MTSAQNSLPQSEERPRASFRKATTRGRTTESTAKELNESLCAVIINASTCLRMLSADPPNVEGARETTGRAIRASNRAAEAVSWLTAFPDETDKVIPTATASIKHVAQEKTEGTG
ncbi:MAG TPA: hypothetical protein VKK06_05675 [Terriglobia bacterium]|nr:hypothetical protein [Candidatus Sulfotelmatobacter sp.]HME99346.1 hypothetical protein [Terriglobia bacterium]